MRFFRSHERCLFIIRIPLTRDFTVEPRFESFARHVINKKSPAKVSLFFISGTGLSVSACALTDLCIELRNGRAAIQFPKTAIS